MHANTEKLMIDARRAYELGRVRSALPVLKWILPLVAVSIAICGEPVASLSLGALLSVTSVYFLWRGQKLGQGVQAGLVIGTATFLIPIFAEVTGKCCALGSHAVLCSTLGLVAGAAVGYHILKVRETEGRYLLSVTAMTILTASLGCAILGLSGTAGLVIGVLIPTIPVYAVLKTRYQNQV